MKTLLLPLLIVGALRASGSDPTAQLVNTLNTASLQLQALGTLTLNNNTFVQLVQVLNTVFGSMNASVMPFYFAQMKSLDAFNQGLATRTFQLNNNIDAVYSVLRNYVESMAASYTQQLAQIGDTLNFFQSQSIQRLDAMKLSMDDSAVKIGALKTQLDTITQDTNKLVLDANDALTQAPIVLNNIPNLINPTKKIVASIDVSGALFGTLGSTILSYCKALVFTFPTPYSTIPAVGLDISPVGEQDSTNLNRDTYDLILESISKTQAVIWICDRSRSTFKEYPSTLIVTAWL